MRTAAALLAMVACSRPPPRGPERDIDVDERAPAAAVVVPDGPAPPDDVLAAPSVAFYTDAPVRAEPSAMSARIGVVGRDARAKPLQARPPGDGCAQRWIAIAPRGWVCEANLAPTQDPPTEPIAVPLDDTAEPELGTYGSVRGASTYIYENRADVEADGGRPAEGAMSVRSTSVIAIRGEPYWVTSDGALISARAIAAITPSTFRGVPVDGELRVAWTHRQGRPRSEVPVRAGPAASAKVVGVLPPRSQVALGETSPDGRFMHVGDAGWVARADLRIPALAEPPAEVGATERWFDVDLDEQILVAYEGKRPVYATLVSTGRDGHRTPPGTARIATKLRATTMTSSKVDEEYSVADVPWTMFYEDTLALHGAYWHDGFGDVRSHGCINLAPRDARILYAWSSPDVPPGWTAVYATPQSPGSLIRIRSRYR